MIECAVKIQSYTARMDQSAFVASPITYDATLRNLEFIGEAVTHTRNLYATRTRMVGSPRKLIHCESDF